MKKVNIVHSPLTDTQIANRGWRLLDLDHMPEEVATEMLCEPKARMTNRQRKECLRARSRSFTSTAERKPADMVIAAKLTRASWKQLNTWRGRAVIRRRSLQTAYEKVLETLGALENNPAVEATLKFRLVSLDRAASAMDTMLDCLNARINYVQQLTTGLDGNTKVQDEFGRTREWLVIGDVLTIPCGLLPFIAGRWVKA